MARFGSKHGSSNYLFVLACISLLGIALIADFLWASSSSSSWSPTSLDLSIESSISIAESPPKIKQGKTKGEVEMTKVSKDLNATFQDLPAPQLEWEEMAEAPVPRLDGAAIQIKNLLYVFAGYGTIDYVHSHVDIYNFTDNTWGGRFDMPKEMAHSHLGMVTDGRYIYVVTGQYGPQCRGPTARNFVLDTEKKEWNDLPPLPVPRYAPATQLWRGRLHVMGGSKEDRHEPALEHWSLAVKDGKALEKEWQSEIPIPRGGPHRACVVANDLLLVIGGQEGDFMAKPGSPIFKCARRSEVVYSNVYMLDDGLQWKELPPMPKPDSHIEFAWKIVNNSIIIAGGTTDKHPVTKKMVLVGEVFRFNLDTMVSALNSLYRRSKFDPSSFVLFLSRWVNYGARFHGRFDKVLCLPIYLLPTHIISVNFEAKKTIGMVHSWTNAFPYQDYVSWILERMAIFHVRPARQGTQRSISEEGCGRRMEN